MVSGTLYMPSKFPHPIEILPWRSWPATGGYKPPHPPLDLVLVILLEGPPITKPVDILVNIVDLAAVQGRRSDRKNNIPVSSQLLLLPGRWVCPNFFIISERAALASMPFC